MKNHRICVVSLTLVLSAFLVVFGSDATEAGGKKGKKKDKDAKAEEKATEPTPLEPVWPSPLDPGLFDPVFKELPFKQPEEQLRGAFAIRLNQQLQPVLRATINPSERDSLNRKLKATIEGFEKSRIAFTGQQTGYAVSVVADEFAQEAGEALYKYAYNENTAYFFMTDQTFWKVLICSETYADYPSLFETLKTTYGEPANVVYRDEEKTQPIEASWKDTTFELRTRAPEGIFVCSRLSWTYVPLVETVTQRRGPITVDNGADASGDALIDQITSGSGENDDDVIDQILKKKKEK